MVLNGFLSSWRRRAWRSGSRTGGPRSPIRPSLETLEDRLPPGDLLQVALITLDNLALSQVVPAPLEEAASSTLPPSLPRLP